MVSLSHRIIVQSGLSWAVSALSRSSFINTRIDFTNYGVIGADREITTTLTTTITTTTATPATTATTATTASIE